MITFKNLIAITQTITITFYFKIAIAITITITYFFKIAITITFTIANRKRNRLGNRKSNRNDFLAKIVQIIYRRYFIDCTANCDNTKKNVNKLIDFQKQKILIKILEKLS